MSTWCDFVCLSHYHLMFCSQRCFEHSEANAAGDRLSSALSSCMFFLFWRPSSRGEPKMAYGQRVLASVSWRHYMSIWLKQRSSATHEAAMPLVQMQQMQEAAWIGWLMLKNALECFDQLQLGSGSNQRWYSGCSFVSLMSACKSARFVSCI